MVKAGKQSAWRPGMAIDGEAHYLEIVAEFGKELIASHTLEELGEAAASNIMLVDALERLNKEIAEARHIEDEISSHRDAKANEALNNSVPLELAVRYQQMENVRFRKEKWGKGGKARAQKYYDKAGAVADWQAEGHKYSSPRGFALNNYKKYGPTDFTTVYRWILANNKASS